MRGARRCRDRASVRLPKKLPDSATCQEHTLQSLSRLVEWLTDKISARLIRQWTSYLGIRLSDRLLLAPSSRCCTQFERGPPIKRFLSLER
ncbi:hypothetical protein VTO42DRAFT_1696 [Malbranchea cinnamomea]